MNDVNILCCTVIHDGPLLAQGPLLRCLHLHHLQDLKWQLHPPRLCWQHSLPKSENRPKSQLWTSENVVISWKSPIHALFKSLLIFSKSFQSCVPSHVPCWYQLRLVKENQGNSDVTKKTNTVKNYLHFGDGEKCARARPVALSFFRALSHAQQFIYST